MYENDLNNNCPVCGGEGTIGYNINSYGQVVKRCNNCNHVIADDTVMTNTTTITDFNRQSTTTTTTNRPLNKCPICGGALAYDTDDEGRLKKYCTRCESNWIIGKDIDTMDKFNETIKQDKNSSIHNINPIHSITTPPQTLEIKCDSITLKQNDISICFHNEKDIKQFDSITINGITFKRVEEDNE